MVRASQRNLPRAGARTGTLALSRRSMRAALVTLAAVLAALVFMTPSAGAAVTHTVTSAGDGGDASSVDNVCDADPGAGVSCTLRAAIEQANAAPGAGPHTIALSALAGTTITP